MFRPTLAIALSFALMLSLLGVTPQVPAVAQGADDFSVPGGWFYSQTNGQGGGGNVGYTITDQAGIPFWSEFQNQGGVSEVGYPISGRFMFKGLVTQAFQKLVFQWQPASEQVDFVNVFDELSAAGHDDWLLTAKSIPRSFDWSSDAGLSFDEIIQRHQAILDNNEATQAAYFAAADPLSMNGLPMAYEEFGNVYVVRAQRTAFQQWHEAVPWAAAGEVVVANGGQIAAEAGLWPAAALTPTEPGGGQQPVPAEPSPTPTPAPPSPQRACAGDERMYFEPENPVSGQQVQIHVSSGRASTNVALTGPADPQYAGAVQTNNQTVWTWTIAPVATGRYDFNFTIDGAVCTTNFFELSAAGPTPSPTANVCQDASYTLSDSTPDVLTPFNIIIRAPHAQPPLILTGVGLASNNPTRQTAGDTWEWEVNAQRPGQYPFVFSSAGQTCLNFTVPVN